MWVKCPRSNSVATLEVETMRLNAQFITQNKPETLLNQIGQLERTLQELRP